MPLVPPYITTSHFSPADPIWLGVERVESKTSVGVVFGADKES